MCSYWSYKLLYTDIYFKPCDKLFMLSRKNFNLTCDVDFRITKNDYVAYNKYITIQEKMIYEYKIDLENKNLFYYT